jgi:hypothetical protein
MGHAPQAAILVTLVVSATSRNEEQMSATKTYKINPSKREEIDNLIRAAVKKAATERKWDLTPAVEAALDRRYTERVPEKKGDVGWIPYERFLLSNGHTVYVNIKGMAVTVSEKPDHRAIQKVDALARRKAERAARKKAREAKKAKAKAETKAKEAKAESATTEKARTSKTKASK